MPTGLGPHEAAVSPDGKRAYVADYGAYNVFREGSRSGPGKTITVLDLAEKKVAATWDIGEYSRPHGIVVSLCDGKSVWVTVEGAKSVVELDAATGKVRKAWKTGQEVSHMIAVTPDETKLYVANIGSGNVSVIDRASGEVKHVATGEGAEGIDVSPDGKEVWVGNRGANTVSVLSTASDDVATTFPSAGTMPIRVKFTPDGKQVWVSNARSASVSVFDVASRTILGTIEVGAVPVGIQMTPDGRTAFVANTNDDRAAYIGGCAATSNVLAGRLLGLPVRGTHAHSWVMAFDTEREAFLAWARAMPNNCVFLVDTYDTLDGVARAADVGHWLREQGHEMIGIRLDSGDLAYLSLEARRVLDAAGFPHAAIVATHDLDENVIAILKAQGAAIGVWGVGTRLVTGHDQPALGGVYKLGAVRAPGRAWQHRVKVSEQAAKTSNPGVQQVRRFSGPSGFVADVIFDE